MKKLICGAVGVVAAMMMTGCVFPNSPIQAPLVLDLGSSTGCFDNAVKPLKQGTAEATGIILVSQGDATITAAMRNGGITKIHHVDTKVQNIFGIVAKYTVTVWGE